MLTKKLPGCQDDCMQMLFEYHGDFGRLEKFGLEVRSMVGGDCYSALLPVAQLERLAKRKDLLKILSLRPVA